MNSTERKALVADLEKHGFRTVRCTADMDGDGVYNETFERPNEDPSEIADRITIEWGKRGPEPLIEVFAESTADSGGMWPSRGTDGLCWSRGPRIGSEGKPLCKLPDGHEGPHRPAPDDGWGAQMQWGEPW